MGPNPHGTQRHRKAAAHCYATQTHCGYCGHYVDQTLPKAHPMSRTADHPIEIALGGDPHPDGLVLMHRRCNTTKSNKARAQRQQRVEIHVDLTTI